MKFYVEDHLSKKEISLFRKIKGAVENMDNPYLGVDRDGKEIILSCHILTRAVHNLFLLKFEDGFYAKLYQHSWLRTKEGSVIDVYPVACMGGPIMIAGGEASPQKHLYVEAPIPVDFMSQSFCHAVTLVTEELWEAFKRYRAERAVSLV